MKYLLVNICLISISIFGIIKVGFPVILDILMVIAVVGGGNWLMIMISSSKCNYVHGKKLTKDLIEAYSEQDKLDKESVFDSCK